MSHNTESRAPIVVLLVVLVAIIAGAIYAITPKHATPLTTGDQIKASSEPSEGVQAGGGSADADKVIEPNPAKDDGTEGPHAEGAPENK